VLRSGPAVAAHFAHRPRQACRTRPGRASITPVRLEQLRLFDVEPFAPPEPVPAFYWAPRPVTAAPAAPGRTTRRRRRRAWLPRLIRWIKSRAAG
jgi:hypothetical protein